YTQLQKWDAPNFYNPIKDLLSTVGFQSITPQGDGNSFTFAMGTPLAIREAFNPLPRKGTETASRSGRGRGSGSSFNPLPRKGTETQQT
ncbi:MAG: hypothetical protein AAFR18_23290, partial [Cyanobacteria bacterium J06627_32]